MENKIHTWGKIMKLNVFLYVFFLTTNKKSWALTVDYTPFILLIELHFHLILPLDNCANNSRLANE